jgi:hypothetical protein
MWGTIGSLLLTSLNRSSFDEILPGREGLHGRSLHFEDCSNALLHGVVIQKEYPVRQKKVL